VTSLTLTLTLSLSLNRAGHVTALGWTFFRRLCN